MYRQLKSPEKNMVYCKMQTVRSVLLI